MTVKVPSVFERYRAPMEQELRRAVHGRARDLAPLVEYHLGWLDREGRPVNVDGGKAVRPALCLYACEAAGGDWRQALPAAAALELAHNFSLVHDDIQDKDIERRHRPTVWYLWGNGQALAAGNIMSILSYNTLLALAEAGVSSQKTFDASRILGRASLGMIEGQCLDLSYEPRLDVTLGEYLDMVSKKTGALLAASLELGAAVATTLSRDHLPAFKRCGLLLGLAFQVQDDLLGIWGDPKRTGKAQGNDIRRRKKSAPIVYALAESRGVDREHLRAIYSQPAVGDAEVNEVLGILDRMGARHHCERLLADYCAQARDALTAVPLSQAAQDDLDQIIAFLSHRAY